MHQSVPGSFRHLLSPLRVGPVVLRNRIQVTAHGTNNVDEFGAPDAREAAYWAARARGGAGLLVTGTNLVHPSSPFTLGQYKNFGPEVMPGLEALARAVHEHGAVVLAQMGHMGQRAREQQVTWGPSPVSWQGRAVGIVPHEMTTAQIADVVRAYGSASRRAVDAGLDGVELAVGHGQLINAFLSPVTNRRTDAYGGSVGARLRFCLEVVHEIREQIGDAVLGFRINTSDLTPGGLDENDWLEIALALERTAAGHFVSVSADFSGSLIPTTYHPHGLWLSRAARFRRLLSLPVFGVGRVTDPALAEEALARGDVDVIGMTRAHIADPDVVAKITAGRARDIRPCIGCLQMCVGELWRGSNVRCSYNPVTGNELTRNHTVVPLTGPRRHLVVVGAGPAGLEAARVAASSGHRVTVLESSKATGGAFARYASLAGRSEFAHATTWLVEQALAAGATIRLATPATVATVAALEPDHVVVAVGARSALPSWAVPSVVRSVEAGLDELGTVVPPTPGRRVAIVDDAYGRGLTTALELARRGHRPTVVSAAPTAAPSMEFNMREDMETRLFAAGGRIEVTTSVAGVERHDCGTHVVAESLGHRLELCVDEVLIATATPNPSIADSLAAALDVPVTLIGDARAPGRLEHAVEAGHLAALDLDHAVLIPTAPTLEGLR